MSIRYLDFSGAVNFWTNIKNYILSKIPTKTSELTNDSGFLTSHQSLDNYVTIDTAQDIEGNKNFKGLLTTIPNGTIWPETARTTDDITYLGANAIHVEQKGSGKLTNLSGGAWSVAELGLGCFFFRINNGTDIRYKNFAQNTVNRIYVVSNANRQLNNVTPETDNTYSLGDSTRRWKECYSNAYYLGTTAFGDIVTHNASEFLTSHQSLSNYSTLANTVKSLSISGKKITVTPGSGSAYTLTTQDTVYTHPTTAGNKHIPSGGSSGQFLGWDSNGTAKWVNNPNTNTTYSAGTGLSLSGTTFSVTSTAGTSTLAWNSEVTLGTVGGLAIKAKLPANPNTDTNTKVTQTVTTANSGYPVLLCATASATATETTTSRFSAGLTVNTRYSSIYITNKYDTANTKGVRNTSNYNNGILYFRSYDETQMGIIRCESNKGGYQQIYMMASNYIKNGAISPEGTATTCYITVRVRDNGSKTIYTDGSWENSLTPYANNTYSLGTSSLQWKNAYIKSLNLNGNAFDPASTSGNIGDIVFARAYYSAINDLTMTAGGNALALIRIENGIYVEDRNNQSLSGTWKFLGSTIPTVTLGNASSTCAGVWKRIA